MPIRFRCPKCQTVLSVGENSVGRAVRCSSCSSAVRVPAPQKQPAAAVQSIATVDDEPVARFQPRTKPAEGDMDMTPMVDVTFLLLVFFMVTAVFTVHRSLEVPPTKEDAVGKPQEVEELKDQAIIVRIDSDNTFWIESPSSTEEIPANSRQEMLAQVRLAKEDSQATEMLVMASLEATHDRVIAALDAGSELKMSPLRLATMEDEDL